MLLGQLIAPELAEQVRRESQDVLLTQQQPAQVLQQGHTPITRESADGNLGSQGHQDPKLQETAKAHDAMDTMPVKRSGKKVEKLGQYEILREIGRGGMGVVYQAIDTNLDRPVALKTIIPSADVNLELLARFENEATSTAKLSHPNAFFN